MQDIRNPGADTRLGVQPIASLFNPALALSHSPEECLGMLASLSLPLFLQLFTSHFRKEDTRHLCIL